MKIHFEKVIPIPLQGFVSDNKIWNTNYIFDSGKHYLINAASGKGKTTLLSIIYGLRSDYEGSIIIDKKVTSTHSYNDWALLRQAKFSIMFQDLRLFPTLTALENILLKNNLTHHYSHEVIIQMANQLDVANLLQRKCETLSLGQQQRIALIRSVCQPFEWLLLDEPFSHLDMRNANKCMELVTLECRKRNAGLILTSLGEYIQEGFDEKIEI